MAQSETEKRPWIPFLLGLGIVGLVIWLTLGLGGDSSPRADRPETSTTASVRGADDDSTTEVGVPALHIAAGGRLTLEEKDLPANGPLAIALELSDEARGMGPRTVRIASVEAGRLETEAVPLAGPGAGMRLEIDRAFLARGLYLIEVDVADQHPLSLRRYVLEVQ